MSLETDEKLGHGLRILVVDDEEVICQFLELALEEWGFEVELFETVATATERCQRHDYDLVLSDKNLPDGSGLDLCTALVEQGVDCKPMVMSGYANLASAVEAIKHGVAEYFVKPLDIDDLHARVTRVVHLLRLERGNRDLIGQLQEKNAALESMAVRDPLTRLYNHAYLQDALQRELARSERHGRTFSFALLDLDRFKEVNDRFGHNTGDRILSEVAQLFAEPARASDLPFHVSAQDLAARFGSDVFALILPETPRAGAAIRLERFRGALRKADLGIEDLPAQTLSAGLVNFPEDATTREELVAAAQTALSAAKETGGDMMVCYSPELETREQHQATQQARRAAALGRSLSEKKFRMVYQPVVHTEDCSIFGYESLCRPTDEGFAHVGELFEATVRLGRVRDLGRILRPLSVAPMEDLPEPMRLFINLHPQDLDDPFLLHPEPELGRWASRIVYEITETEGIADYARARERIAALRSHGFSIALDDLGAGYSSLNCLAQLSPDYVKLDMELIRGIAQDSRAARLIRHLLDFCRGEDMMVVGEGIETVEELSVVRELGVPLVQGYLFARPVEPFCAVATPGDVA